ncbi:MAG: Abi family protein [Sneathiella sp.]
MNLNDNDIRLIGTLLSAERLNALETLTGSTREAIELHQQILRLGASLMTVTAVIEIAIRNAVCNNLSDHFNTPDWLLNPPPPFEFRESEKNNIGKALASARRAEYTKLKQNEKHTLDNQAFPMGKPRDLKHKKRAAKRQEKINVTTGKVIAELTLFFWKRMYANDYEETLWKTSLKRTFPDKKLRRADISPHLEQIYQTRNRLAHHEPVYGWRIEKTLKSIEFVTKRLGADHADNENPLAKLLFEDIKLVHEQSACLKKRIASFNS